MWIRPNSYKAEQNDIGKESFRCDKNDLALLSDNSLKHFGVQDYLVMRQVRVLLMIWKIYVFFLCITRQGVYGYKYSV